MDNLTENHPFTKPRFLYQNIVKDFKSFNSEISKSESIEETISYISEHYDENCDDIIITSQYVLNNFYKKLYDILRKNNSKLIYSALKIELADLLDTVIEFLEKL